MKSILIALGFLIYYLTICAQNTNLGLQYIDHSTGITHNYTTSHINSDFGMRNCTDCTLWHKGIDINRTDDLGDRILSPVDGEVAQIWINTTYIVLLINGVDGASYGYGHIFHNYSISSLPIELGDFVLAKCEPPNSNKLAIIDLLNNRAFSTIDGGEVKYIQQLPYTTSRYVESGWPIAPVGDSYATNGPHLHLYLVEDAFGSPTDNHNTKNPLQILTHQDSQFDVILDSITNLTEYGHTVFCGGNQKASSRIKIRMFGAGNTSTYTNQIMDVDSVLLQIKKYSEPDDNYKLIKGDNFFSKIDLGGKIGHVRYPSKGSPPSNTEFDIVVHYGSTSKTGIDPHAYSGKPYDFWYFSDFYTRIHKKDYFSGPVKLANSIAEARYPDGIYYLRPKAYRINNEEAVNPANPNNNAPKQIIIDNFQPYISFVKIKESGAFNYKYERGWHWVNNKMLLSPLPESKILNQNVDVLVEITSSEPMKKVKLLVGNHPPLEMECGTNLNKTQWMFTLSHNNLTPGQHELKISGEDLAGNQILSNPSVVHIRQSNSNWQPPLPSGSPLPDTWHSFIFGESEVDFDAEQTGIEYTHVKFTDKSTISGTYLWEFGDPKHKTDNSKDTEFTYDNLGTYIVKHTVNQSAISKPVSVNQLTIPQSKFVFVPWFGGNKSNSPTVSVDFFSISEGIISEYLWDFGNGEYSTEKNPENILLNLNEWYTVKLTVKNAVDTDIYQEEIYLDPATYPYASVFDWEMNYFVHDIEVLASNFDENDPITYTIDFGDGTSETIEEADNNSYTFTHQYFKMGTFLAVASVTGTYSGNNKTVTTAKEIKVTPQMLGVEILPPNSGSPPYPLQDVTFNTFIDPDGTFIGSWAIYKKGDPVFYKSWNFNNSSPQLTYQFPQAGTYRVIIDVYEPNLAVSGHAELEFEVVNAPDYIDVTLFGSDQLSINTHYTYEANLLAIGEPGVPDSKWWTTNLRWTLFRPNGQTEIVSDIFEYWDSQFIKYKTFSFTDPGEYTLRLEAWNNQHEYAENNFLSPEYVNTISFYDYTEKKIIVSGAIPALEILSPATSFPDPVSASGDDDIVLKFTNPGTTPIRWEVIQGAGLICEDCISIPQPSAGQNLANGSQKTLIIDVKPNLLVNSRFSLLQINGFDAANNHVQGSPAYIQIDQNGTAGPGNMIVEGNSPDHMFGYSVSIDGLTAVIGAPVSSGSSKGYAYIYEKNAYGEWEQKAQLKPSDDNGDFGKSVDISGDYVIVSGEGSFKTYIYRKPANDWSGSFFETKLIANLFLNNNGINVTIWGDYAAIGAPYFGDKGTVWLYYRNQGGVDNWGLIKIFEGYEDDDLFGNSVDLYNDILAVGAPQGDWNHGYINVYNRNLNGSNTWGLKQTIQPDLISDTVDMKFGRNVSVFNDAIASSYFFAYSTGKALVGYLQFPIYRITNGTLYEKIGEGSWWLHGNEPFGNIINSISLYKDVCGDNKIEYDYSCIVGSAIRFDNRGQTGGCHFVDISGWEYQFAWLGSLMNHYPSEFYGNSVSKSFNTQITGIPGYERTANKKGAVEFQRLAPYNSNYEAGLEFEFTNFTKPAGVYSTTNARKITLGGNALPAVISGDANTQYEAEEVLLKNGFLTNQGAIFTAKSLKDNNSDHQISSGNKEQEQKDFQKNEILKAFRNACPDFPWYLFDPSSEIVIIDDRKPENGLSNDPLFNPANINERPEEPISQNQSGLFLQLKGHDKRLRYPIKQNNNNLTNR